MIESIEIKNFQSHKYSKLELTEGVNIIQGTSDSGKSAIIRSLRSLLYNRLHVSFRSDWGGDSNVTINFNNGKVSRKRGKEFNGYELDIGTKMLFEATKTEVPKEINDFLNMNEINLQQQFDKPFLISNTPGEVASHFNKIARIDNIGKAIKNVKSWGNDINRELRYKKEQLEIKQEQLKEYDYLEKFEVDVDVLEGMENEKNKIEIALVKLMGITNQIEKINEKLLQYQEKTKMSDEIDYILLLIGKRNELDSIIDTIGLYITPIEQNKKEIENYEHLLNAEKEVNKILQLIEEKKQIEKEINTLKEKIGLIEQNISELEFHIVRYNKLKEKFDAEMPDICPLCNTNLKK
jgi:exonuclease SbcC